MSPEEFRKHGHQVIDWVADYLENIEKYPVKSQVKPGEIKAQIADHAPESGESFDSILADVETKILPGITHWQHPNFHAYFNGNSSYPSILGELVTSAIGAQCMIWETSPAAAELEEQMMNWLAEMTGLPKEWDGVIQDTASTGTLTAILTARERATSFGFNQTGSHSKKLRVYCSDQTHSSIDKAVKVAGIGIDNLVKIGTDENLAMKPALLQAAIKDDLENGYQPCCIVGSLGTTGTTAMDPIDAIAEIATEYDIWLHVDAAFAGTAFVLPELRHWLKGVDKADSYLFNPHKWMFVNFDCCAYYVKDKESLIRTFEILPEYLKTGTRGQVNDYRDWGIQLGRRFRALKLWFVIREYGVSGIRKRVSEHIEYAQWLEKQIHAHDQFEMMAPRSVNLVVFRYCGGEEEENERVNQSIIDQINLSGEAYLTHTRINDTYVLRVVTGQTNTQLRHIEKLWNLILEALDY